MAEWGLTQSMRRHVVILVLAVLGAGCSSSNQDPSLPPGVAGTAVIRSKTTVRNPTPVAISAKPDNKLIVLPDNLLAGRVAVFNPAGRFVVVYFPGGSLPAIDQRMGVYRQGLKVGEVKFSGPQRDDNIVADLIEGEAQAGDEVRAD